MSRKSIRNLSAILLATAAIFAAGGAAASSAPASGSHTVAVGSVHKVCYY
jgi:hypothetical protein